MLARKRGADATYGGHEDKCPGGAGASWLNVLSGAYLLEGEKRLAPEQHVVTSGRWRWARD